MYMSNRIQIRIPMSHHTNVIVISVSKHFQFCCNRKWNPKLIRSTWMTLERFHNLLQYILLLSNCNIFHHNSCQFYISDIFCTKWIFDSHGVQKLSSLYRLFHNTEAPCFCFYLFKLLFIYSLFSRINIIQNILQAKIATQHYTIKQTTIVDKPG